MMQCPVDQHTLERKTRKGLTLHECPKCHGLLLPVHALPKAKKTGLIKKAGGPPCPKCLKPMDTTKQASQRVFACNDCLYVWVKEKTVRTFRNKRNPITGSNVATTTADIFFDAVFYFPELIIDGAVGLVHVAEATGDAIGDFFGELLSELF